MGGIVGKRSCELYTTLETPRGRVEIRRACSPDAISRLKLAQGFGFFLNPAMGVEPLVKAASRGDYVALAIHDTEIVGFLVAYRWSQESYGGRIAYEDVYDIATEVSRKWRRMGIGKALLEATVTDAFFDDKVLLIRGNPDYWDCYGSECQKYATFIMEVPVIYYGFKKLPIKLPGDLFTLAKVGPKSNVKLEDIIRVIEQSLRALEGEFY